MEGRSRSTSVTLSDIPEPQPFSAAATSLSQNLSDSLHPILVQDLKDFASRDEVPSITSLSDTPSDSESSTPIGSGSMAATPALPPAERPQHPERRVSPAHEHGQLNHPENILLPYRPVNDHPRAPPQLHTDSALRFDQPIASSSTETTPTHLHLQPSPSGYTLPRHFPHLTPRPTASAAPSQQRLPPLPPGYTTEFQHYYETVESRRTSDFSGVGMGTGFVSGFEPVGSLMLDGTWQGFLEQLGF